eukprot:1479004-Rhodomonas_salina.3
MQAPAAGVGRRKEEESTKGGGARADLGLSSSVEEQEESERKEREREKKGGGGWRERVHLSVGALEPFSGLLPHRLPPLHSHAPSVNAPRYLRAHCLGLISLIACPPPSQSVFSRILRA